ncbi:MAG: hypothetical protein RJA69_1007, partial [Pseudomonadota bacterium]
TRQFLDDLGLASLDQLPLLSTVDHQTSALAGLVDEEPLQAALSLGAALEEAPQLVGADLFANDESGNPPLADEENPEHP